MSNIYLKTKTGISLVKKIVIFIIYILLQLAFLTPSLSIHNAVCFIYVGYLIYMPIKSSELIIQLITAFILGLIIDCADNSFGIHASASVALIFVRDRISKYILNNIHYTKGINISIQTFNFIPTIIITILPTLTHHFLIFMLENLDNCSILLVVKKSILSTLYSIFVIFMLKYTLYKNSV